MKKRAIFIEANRNGYHPRQCGRTLTAEEFLGAIEECLGTLGSDEGVEVYVSNDNGYTYGSISWGDVFAGVYDEDKVYTAEDDEFFDIINGDESY